MIESQFQQSLVNHAISTLREFSSSGFAESSLVGYTSSVAYRDAFGCDLPAYALKLLRGPDRYEILEKFEDMIVDGNFDNSFWAHCL